MPTRILTTLPRWFSEAAEWTASFCLTLLRSPHPDQWDDLCQYGDAGAYRRELPRGWR